MGRFIGVVAASLREQDDTFIQGTEVLEFLGEVWVYYCRPHLGRAPRGWLDLADDTLRVSLNSPPMRHDLLTWEPLVTSQGEGSTFEYMAAQFGVAPGNNLFHLALPPYYLPIAASWDITPLYGHADGPRFVIGWGGYENIWPALSFKLNGPADFSSLAKGLEQAIEHQGRERREQVFNPWGRIAEADAVSLHRRLDEQLNLEEVKTLVFELGLDYDNLGGETKRDKLRELLLFLERQGQLSRLAAHLNLAYPHTMRP